MLTSATESSVSSEIRSRPVERRDLPAAASLFADPPVREDPFFPIVACAVMTKASD